jgi:hypothetical protein
MRRRNLIKGLAYAAGFPLLSTLDSSAFGQTSSYDGKLLVSVQLEGGLDVTSFCDPKMNVAGEAEINHWARADETRQVGNLSYAPYASNQFFFEKYYRDMLVINGVDAQTNAHTVGVLNNWSGRSADGFPSLTALHAANNAANLPLPYLNFGGFGGTGGIIRSTVIARTAQLRDIIFPNLENYGGERLFRSESDWARIQALQLKTLQRLNTEPSLLLGDQKSRQLYLDSFSKADALKPFGNLLPDASSIQPTRFAGAELSSLHQQIQSALIAFKAGVSVAADVVETGYDTHSNQDRDHEPLLVNSIDAIDYLWTYAEELGLADRLVVLIGTDFGRTPFYNGTGGKDHWPIGSTVVMERNVEFTNRALGETDEGHNAKNINPDTLLVDNINGVGIKPAHVHKALRRYLGFENSEITQRFAFNNIEDFNFFG